MTISRATTPPKPQGDVPIPKSVLAYFRARLRHRFHSMILEEFTKSDITQADLARRLGQDAALVHRWLSEPRNLRLSTLSDLVFAINGGEPSKKVVYPLDAAPANNTKPEWLTDVHDNLKLEAKAPSKTSTKSMRQIQMVGEPI